MQDHKRDKVYPLTVEAENNQTVYALAKIKELEEERDALRQALTKEVESRVAYWKASRYEVMALESHVEQMRSTLQVAREESVDLATLAWNAGNILSIDLMQAEIKKRNDLCELIDKVLESTPRQSLAAIKVKTLREVAVKLEDQAFARSDGSFHDAAVFVEQEAEKIEKEIA